jgi:hypothetical protein
LKNANEGHNEMTAAPAAALLQPAPEYAIDTKKLNLWYGTFQALYDVDLRIRQGMITSMIGPSGVRQEYLPAQRQSHQRTPGLRAHRGQYRRHGPEYL